MKNFDKKNAVSPSTAMTCSADAPGENAERQVVDLRNQIEKVRTQIFFLAKNAPSLEIIHWYCWLDESFENDEFSPEDFDKVQWRISALVHFKEPVNYLANLITPILQAHGCVDKFGATTR